VSRKLDIFDCRFPIADFYHRGAISDFRSAIVDRKIGNEKPRAANNAGLSAKTFGRLKDSPSCLAVCFTWPQVALTHHVFLNGY